jgi:hypothetical protein
MRTGSFAAILVTLFVFLTSHSAYSQRASLNPASLNFGNQPVGTTSPAQVTVSNKGHLRPDDHQRDSARTVCVRVPVVMAKH